MSENKQNQAIGYALLIIFGYYVISAFIPFLICGVVALVFWRIYGEYLKRKK